jgi:hypothetical protein
MTAVKSKRESILEQLRLSVLTDIDPETDESYNLNINFISRDFREPHELQGHEFPCVFIVDDFMTSYESLTADIITTGNDRLNIGQGMNIGIIGYVKETFRNRPDKAGSLSTLMNQMFSDILIAMYKDFTMGGNALSVDLLSSRNAIQHSQDDDIGVVILIFSIKYDFSPINKIT